MWYTLTHFLENVGAHLKSGSFRQKNSHAKYFFCEHTNWSKVGISIITNKCVACMHQNLMLKYFYKCTCIYYWLGSGNIAYLVGIRYCYIIYVYYTLFAIIIVIEMANPFF